MGRVSPTKSANPYWKSSSILVPVLRKGISCRQTEVNTKAPTLAVHDCTKGEAGFLSLWIILLCRYDVLSKKGLLHISRVIGALLHCRPFCPPTRRKIWYARHHFWSIFLRKVRWKAGTEMQSNFGNGFPSCHFCPKSYTAYNIKRSRFFCTTRTTIMPRKRFLKGQDWIQCLAT